MNRAHTGFPPKPLIVSGGSIRKLLILFKPRFQHRSRERFSLLGRSRTDSIRAPTVGEGLPYVRLLHRGGEPSLTVVPAPCGTAGSGRTAG